MGNPHAHGNSKERKSEYVCLSTVRRRGWGSGSLRERNVIDRKMRKSKWLVNMFAGLSEKRRPGGL